MNKITTEHNCVIQKYVLSFYHQKCKWNLRFLIGSGIGLFVPKGVSFMSFSKPLILNKPAIRCNKDNVIVKHSLGFSSTFGNYVRWGCSSSQQNMKNNQNIPSGKLWGKGSPLKGEATKKKHCKNTKTRSVASELVLENLGYLL